jgi:hypothetical protein
VIVQTARHNGEELFLHGTARFALSRVFRHQAVGW